MCILRVRKRAEGRLLGMGRGRNFSDLLVLNLLFHPLFAHLGHDEGFLNWPLGHIGHFSGDWVCTHFEAFWALLGGMATVPGFYCVSAVKSS